MHYYACVILLPVLASTKYFSLTSFEVGIMFTGQTCGMLISFKVIEPVLKCFGLNYALNLGFFMLTSANFALWCAVLKLDNSSDFATLVFLSRFGSGIGSGIIDAACMISRTYHSKREKNQD